MPNLPGFISLKMSDLHENVALKGLTTLGDDLVTRIQSF